MAAPGSPLRVVERSLTAWVFLGIAAGVLIEVPVMLSVVQIVNRTKGWYVLHPSP